MNEKEIHDFMMSIRRPFRTSWKVVQFSLTVINANNVMSNFYAEELKLSKNEWRRWIESHPDEVGDFVTKYADGVNCTTVAVWDGLPKKQRKK